MSRTKKSARGIAGRDCGTTVILVLFRILLKLQYTINSTANKIFYHLEKKCREISEEYL
jgi:hypothetical protein